MLLAADVGGTKTLLGLFARAPERPKRIEVGEFVTLDYEDLVPMIREFLKANGLEARAIEAATFGVAGAVTDQVARLTNVPWVVDAAAVEAAAGLRRVHVLNDLEAMAFSVAVLEPSELALLTPAAFVPARTCAGVGTIADPADLPQAISRSALEKRCAQCVESLDLFVAAYGAEAGNLALRTAATAGVYIGGGIAPKILPALETGAFVDAFRAKEPLSAFVATIPIAVILNSEAGLLGAAVHANIAA